MHTVKDKIIVSAFKEASTEAPGTVYIPDDAKEQSIEGIVVSTGPDVEGVNEHDHIMYNPNRAVKFTIRGEEFVVIELQDVFIVMEDSKNGQKSE